VRPLSFTVRAQHANKLTASYGCDLGGSGLGLVLCQWYWQFVRMEVHTHGRLPAGLPGRDLSRRIERTAVYVSVWHLRCHGLSRGGRRLAHAPWMPRAFLVWSVAAVLLGAFFLLEVPAELILGGKTAAVAFALGLAAILWLIYQYLKRVAVGGSSAAL
jgi:hypothetical protein